jgi:excisionase family DNA binding protein
MKLLTETQVAERFEITKPCLRRWRHEGRGLPFVRVGRLVRYRPEDVEKFIADNMQDVSADGKSKELRERELGS